MEKFMLIIREDLKKLHAMTYEQRMVNTRLMQKWVEGLAETGNYVMGEPLLAIGRYVSQEKVTSDGPFIESKEGISGMTIFNAENLEQAVAFAQSCPLVLNGEAVVEVRPIMAMPE
ncbi:MAG: YciI family protein [Cyclobacteriaceae bacterium]